MRRYARALILIAALVVVSVTLLSIQKIEIGNFERGEDTVLGLSLGLDLQGGIDLRYQAVDSVTREPIVPEADQMEALKRSIEDRINASGLGEPNIQLLGDDRLLIQLPGVTDPARAKEIIGETAQLIFRHRRLDVPRELEEISNVDIVSVTAGPLPLNGEEEDTIGTTTAPQVAPAEEDEGDTATEIAGTTTATTAAGIVSEGEEGGDQPATGEEPGAEGEEEDGGPPVLILEFTDEGAEKFAEVMERLSDSLVPTGFSGDQPRVYPSRLDIALDGAETRRFDVTAFSVLRIGSSTRFAFPFPQIGGAGAVTDVAAARAILGDNPVIHLTEIQGKVDEEIREGSLTGNDLSRAFPSQHGVTSEPIVSLQFKTRGTKIWGELTTRIAGSQTDQIAIFLDNQELISPVVTTPITSGTTIIQGNFTLDRVKDIALLLQSGALPLSIELIQERDVDAILGSDSLAKSVVAGLVGLSLVLLFMVLYYRVPGIIGAVALLIYASLLLAIFKAVPVTLTLSGIAAVILSIGMAVDANILIFERMKEELRAGRTLLSAINIGFNRAWPAIRDGNVSTLITCAILFWFADQLQATVVQGFAIALAIGVFISMFTAITVSRTLLRVVATTRLSHRLGMFVPSGGGDLPQHQRPATAPGTPGS